MSESTERHPKGLVPLFFTEMWERFSFYLMLGILYQYLVDSEKGGMGWTGEQAAQVFGSYIALVYFTPFLGGILADRVLGCRKAVVIGGVFMMIGHIVLAFPSAAALYVALGCLIIGNGFFKPNISTLVGNLYPPGSPLRDAGFNIFYMGINIGAFICNFVAAIVRNKWGWHAAFATAGVGMFIGLMIFTKFQSMFAHADHDPGQSEHSESLTPLFLECLLPAGLLTGAGFVLARANGGTFLGFNGLTLAFLLACLPVVVFYLRTWRAIPEPTERGRVGALLAIYGVVVVFWMIFHQNGTALTEWAIHNTNRVPGGVMASVVGLAPDFAEPAPPSYFFNAGPEVARPARDTYQVVSDEEYKTLEKAHELSVEDGKPVQVTAGILEKVFARADASTPSLPPLQQVKLINPELFQSINAGFVVMLTPLLVPFWMALRKRGMEPSTPGKIGLGLLLTAGGPAIMLVAVLLTHAYDPATEVKSSATWLFGVYFVVTLGELCLSPMGLSLVTKMAPDRMRSLMMGGWFLSTAVGNKLSGIFGELYQTWDPRTFYVVLMVSVLAAAGAIYALLPWLRSQMPPED